MKKIILFILLISSFLTSCSTNTSNIEQTNITPYSNKSTYNTENQEEIINDKPLLDEDNIVTIGSTGLKFSVPMQFLKISREDVLKALEKGNEISNTSMTDEEKESFLDSSLYYVDKKNGDNIKLVLDNSIGELSLGELADILSNPTENMTIEELEIRDIEIEKVPAKIIQFKTSSEGNTIYHNYIAFIKDNSSFIALFLTKEEIDLNSYEKFFSIDEN